MKYIILSIAFISFSTYTSVNENDITKFEKYIEHYNPVKNNASFGININVNEEDNYPSIDDKKLKIKIHASVNFSILEYLKHDPLNFKNTTNNTSIASALLAQAKIIDLLNIMAKLFLKMDYYQTTYHIGSPIIKIVFGEKSEKDHPSTLTTNDRQTFAIAFQVSPKIGAAISEDEKLKLTNPVKASKECLKRVIDMIEMFEIEIKNENLHPDAKKYLANQIITLTRLQIAYLYKMRVPYFFNKSFGVLLQNKQYQALTDVALLSNAYLHLKEGARILDIIPHGKETITLFCQLMQRYQEDANQKKMIIIIDESFKKILTDIELLIQNIEPFKPLYSQWYQKIINSKQFNRFPKVSMITAMYDTWELMPNPVPKSTLPTSPLYPKSSQTTIQPQLAPALFEFLEKEKQGQEKKKEKAKGKVSIKKTTSIQKPLSEPEEKVVEKSGILESPHAQFDINAQTPICYDKRIMRWFDNSFRQMESFSSNLYHSYPLIADYYIKAFGIQSTHHSPTRTKDIDDSYILAGEIEYNDDKTNEPIKEHVIYVITFDPKGICYHRGFSTKDFASIMGHYFKHIDSASEKNKAKSTPLKELATTNITQDLKITGLSQETDTICPKIENSTGTVIEENNYYVVIEDIFNNAIITLYKPLKS